VNKFISAVKKVFMKAPARIQTYREQFPTLPHPPKPVITRWDTWIKSASFYSEHYMEIKEVINQFKSVDALSIRDAKKAFETPSIQYDLNLIYTHFSKIPELITSLESRNLLLNNSLKVMEELLIIAPDCLTYFQKKSEQRLLGY
jgi:hypothetical protein